ncbi:hypothetical protein FHG87_001883 [Trinorchestia longiramus]|nr:hypothetical protein FHG87_001883 [Trinorchestia longiramus]
MGNFNRPDINWTVRTSRRPESKLIDLIDTISLQQYVSKRTRQNNIFDLVITTPDLKIIRLEIPGKIGDHHGMDFMLHVYDPYARTRLTNVLKYTRANFELMKEMIGSFDYEILIRNKNDGQCYIMLEKSKLPQNIAS